MLHDWSGTETTVIPLRIKSNLESVAMNFNLTSMRSFHIKGPMVLLSRIPTIYVPGTFISVILSHEINLVIQFRGLLPISNIYSSSTSVNDKELKELLTIKLPSHYEKLFQSPKSHHLKVIVNCKAVQVTTSEHM